MSIFKKPKVTVPPPPPPAAVQAVQPEPVVTPDEAVQAGTEKAALKRRMKTRKGRRATILTGPRGLLNEAPVQRETLLAG